MLSLKSVNDSLIFSPNSQSNWFTYSIHFSLWASATPGSDISFPPHLQELLWTSFCILPWRPPLPQWATERSTWTPTYSLPVGPEISAPAQATFLPGGAQEQRCSSTVLIKRRLCRSILSNVTPHNARWKNTNQSQHLQHPELKRRTETAKWLTASITNPNKHYLSSFFFIIFKRHMVKKQKSKTENLLTVSSQGTICSSGDRLDAQ